jgi:hypothetical protein
MLNTETNVELISKLERGYNMEVMASKPSGFLSYLGSFSLPYAPRSRYQSVQSVNAHILGSLAVGL